MKTLIEEYEDEDIYESSSEENDQEANLVYLNNDLEEKEDEEENERNIKLKKSTIKSLNPNTFIILSPSSKPEENAQKVSNQHFKGIQGSHDEIFDLCNPNSSLFTFQHNWDDQLRTITFIPLSATLPI